MGLLVPNDGVHSSILSGDFCASRIETGKQKELPENSAEEVYAGKRLFAERSADCFGEDEGFQFCGKGFPYHAG